ncbi:MAG: hypothetical protein D6744_07380 [Planctomycetota bacterium]|nr:MAG: hypothetical protein D6744_07380 [Planctomycetota bacterium]
MTIGVVSADADSTKTGPVLLSDHWYRLVNAGENELWYRLDGDTPTVRQPPAGFIPAGGWTITRGGGSRVVVRGDTGESVHLLIEALTPTRDAP